ncbi:M15 family metallopeptidase [Neobacillus muris]|uniref:M15 family metallopeptidase n=1 Tax=Neobacillus muris TaxID=2941334 RepID=UPI00203B42DC|nr:M15 family metallopeptidase [Neobacillus muris]
MKKILTAVVGMTFLLCYLGWENSGHTFDTKPSSIVNKISRDEKRVKESISDAAMEANGKASDDEKMISADTNGAEGVAAFTDPSSLLVLVNKQYGLPEEYRPRDLVYPDVPFLFSDKIDKRKMREEAAKALEQLFSGAKEDGISLMGVSAYRSYKTQTDLFDYYVHREGEKAAETFSAFPGHSEHETGLAIDVTGGDGRCAAEDCFADTEAAKWLAEHAHEYGFIIRYPEGKEQITGYKYEPWHIRYVGKKSAKEMAERGITLEEFLTPEQTGAK